MTPLVRDFYYQPMMYDLLDVENDIVNYEKEVNDVNINKKAHAMLEDNDDLFSRYRYRHIAGGHLDMQGWGEGIAPSPPYPRLRLAWGSPTPMPMPVLKPVPVPVSKPVRCKGIGLG